MIIYTITNKVTFKQYIGQTTKTLEQRWKQHCGEAKRGKITPLYISIRKYGAENFEIEEVATADSLEELNAMEVSAIKRLNTLVPNGYNLDGGGKNKIIHAETRKRMSDAHKGIPLSLEHAANAGKGHKGKKRKPHSDETKAKISKARTGVRIPQEAIERGAAKRRGQKRTSEQRENISRSLKGKPNKTKGKKTGQVPWNKGKTGIYTEEALQRMSDSRKGKPGHPQTEETKHKISTSTKGRKASDEARENIRQSKLGDKNPMFGRVLSQEHKDKLSAARRKRDANRP